MKVGKYINGEMQLVTCEQGKEVGDSRTVEELYADGYKDMCEVERPSETSVVLYQEFETCFVQIWTEPEPEPDETDYLALKAFEGEDMSEHPGWKEKRAALRAEYRTLESNLNNNE